MRRKPATRKSARTYLAGLYSRLSKSASAGLRRLRGRANRAGPAHIAEDLAEFDYIEKEAHDILAAVARLRARDLGETMTEPAYLPEPSYAMEPAGMLEPMPETLMEYAPETTANQARGRRRRNRSGFEVAEKDRKKVLMAIYKHTNVSNKHIRNKKHLVMLSGLIAERYGVPNYASFNLEDLSNADLYRLAHAMELFKSQRNSAYGRRKY